MLERPAQHLHLTMGGTHPRTMSERHAQHSHLTTGGTRPKPMSKRPSTHIRPHLVRNALHLHLTMCKHVVPEWLCTYI